MEKTNENNEMITMVVYTSDTPLFSEKLLEETECLIDLPFPEEMVREFYEANKNDFDKDCDEWHPEVPMEDRNFEVWLDSYIAESTVGLYGFCAKRGYYAIPDGHSVRMNYTVADNHSELTVTVDNTDECRTEEICYGCDPAETMDAMVRELNADISDYLERVGWNRNYLDDIYGGYSKYALIASQSAFASYFRREDG